MHCNCPGSHEQGFEPKQPETQNTGDAPNELRQWPVQLHLVNPQAPYYQGKDVLLAADCCAYTYGNFHRDYMKGKSIAIACPKLDTNQDVYVEKIRSWIDDAKINSLTITIMQVPCCRGLLQVAQEALAKTVRKIPVKFAVIGLQGEIIEENWL